MTTELTTKRGDAGLSTADGFETLQRIAKMFTLSKLVPTTFQNNLPDCVIALHMAQRMGADPMMVMQNLYVVHGRPAWSSQFLIATFNHSGRFSSIRYEWGGKEGTDSWSCTACATELASGTELRGTTVSIAMAKAEGWHGRNGSKWQTIPQLMLQYRAAAFFVRTHAPEIAMGLPLAEEAEESVIDVTATPAAANIGELFDSKAEPDAELSDSDVRLSDSESESDAYRQKQSGSEQGNSESESDSVESESDSEGILSPFEVAIDLIRASSTLDNLESAMTEIQSAGEMLTPDEHKKVQAAYKAAAKKFA